MQKYEKSSILQKKYIFFSMIGYISAFMGIYTLPNVFYRVILDV